MQINYNYTKRCTNIIFLSFLGSRQQDFLVHDEQCADHRWLLLLHWLWPDPHPAEVGQHQPRLPGEQPSGEGRSDDLRVSYLPHSFCILKGCQIGSGVWPSWKSCKSYSLPGRISKLTHTHTHTNTHKHTHTNTHTLTHTACSGTLRQIIESLLVYVISWYVLLLMWEGTHCTAVISISPKPKTCLTGLMFIQKRVFHPIKSWRKTQFTQSADVVGMNYSKLLLASLYRDIYILVFMDERFIYLLTPLCAGRPEVCVEWKPSKRLFYTARGEVILTNITISPSGNELGY